MPEAAPRPDGIPGSGLPGPWPVGQYAAALRERLRGFARVQVFGEVFGLKAGRAKVWFELRDGSGALPCSMWRRDWDALGLESLGDGSVVVAAGGCGFYPGARGVVAFVLVRGVRAARRRRGESARAGRAPSQGARRRGAVRAAEAAGGSRPPRGGGRSRRSGWRGRRCRASSASCRARAARRATTSSRACGGAAGRGG